MNKQPHYHRATILFTATEPVSEKELLKRITKALSGKPFVRRSVEIEEFDEPQPGDPSDLIG